VSSPQHPDPEDLSTETEDDIAAMTAELEARSVELDQFFRTAAHDLRAPLRSIEAFTRLATETDDQAEAAEHLDRVLKAVGRMRRLLDSLLDYADAGRQAPALTTIPLDEVVQAALADLAVDLEESRATIAIGDLPDVECDPTQLQRVFVNVLANSIGHSTEPERTIDVRAHVDSDRVLVTIADDGDGFAPDLAEEVFQPFRRLSTSAGQGIGLAICRRIVERHGGEIWAETAPGVGTTVSITLPRAGVR
jgi:signal transduction histidine kinase